MNILNIVMEDLIKQIDAGVDPWQASWKCQMPTNATTRARYRGINVLVLWVGQLQAGYATHEWASYKQWRSIGAQVRKGEKHTKTIFYKEAINKKTDDPYRMMRWSQLFNADQVDGYEPKITPLPVMEERHAIIDTFVEQVGVKLATSIGIGGPAYSPKQDMVLMPDADEFDNADAFYAGLFHEIGHWTGHPSRLDRPKGNHRDSYEYAYEELIAEISAAFLGQHFNTAPDNHSGYLKHWLDRIGKLRGPNTKTISLQQAATDATKAFDYLIDLTEEQEKAA